MQRSLSARLTDARLALTDALEGVWYSFAAQLFLFHFQSNPVLLAVWGLFAVMVSGGIGRGFGLQLMFLDADYLGKVGFWSYFFIGFCFSVFAVAWNLTTYVLNSYRFPFLASLTRPFTKYCLNNLPIPVAFVGYYLYCIERFQVEAEVSVGTPAPVQAWRLLAGFLVGMTLGLLLAALYFFLTNRDQFSFLKTENLDLPFRLRERILRRTMRSMRDNLHLHALPVRTYFSPDRRRLFTVRAVRSVAHYDRRILIKVFKQHHTNALIVMLAAVVAMIALGFGIENPAFMIPPLASIFILFTLVLGVIGFLSYWLERWYWAGLFFLLLFGNYISSLNLINEDNRAYGLDYSVPPAHYNYRTFDSLACPAFFEEDSLATIAILHNWRLRNPDIVSRDTIMKKSGTRWQKRIISRTRKPKMVLFCTSGGGMLSGLFTLGMMQRADSLTGGQMTRHTTLITGASGGMLGAALYRELHLEQEQANAEAAHLAPHPAPLTPNIRQTFAHDLLSPIMFSMAVNDFFIPWMRLDYEGKHYHKDRGYFFEQAFIRNCGGRLDKPLVDYAEPEQRALVPMMFITPVAVNDGRRLLISPQHISYMTKPRIAFRNSWVAETDGVEFRRLFERQRADRLRFATALRMNATYPYILPSVGLPTDPAVDVMDAGLADNYGITFGSRFADVFSDFIRLETDGIVVVQCLESESRDVEVGGVSSGAIARALRPLSAARLFTAYQRFYKDNALNHLVEIFGRERVDFVPFIYRPKNPKVPASLSFHLTAREQADVLAALDHPENRKAFAMLARLLKQ